jgi:hypothetical protein
VCTPPQFIGGLVAHDFHASVRIYLGGESFARRETAQQLAEADPAGWRKWLQKVLSILDANRYSEVYRKAIQANDLVAALKK